MLFFEICLKTVYKKTTMQKIRLDISPKNHIPSPQLDFYMVC